MLVTLDMTRAELSVLLWGAAKDLEEWRGRASVAESRGWRDAKEKDRVLTYLHAARCARGKVQAAINAIDRNEGRE